MSKQIYRTEQLNDAQVVELLSMALPFSAQHQSVLQEFRRLVGLPSRELINALRNALQENGLAAKEAARLLGVTDITITRWLASSKEFSDETKHKLAGLCVLLALASEDASVSDAGRLARAAILVVRDESDLDAVDMDRGSVGLLKSVFGVAGLSASALYTAINVSAREIAFEEGE